jgi:hypothetical protein
MIILRDEAERALLARLAGGARTRNNLLRKITPPNGIFERTWYLALKDALNRLCASDRVQVNEEPGTPLQRYQLVKNWAPQGSGRAQIRRDRAAGSRRSARPSNRAGGSRPSQSPAVGMARRPAKEGDRWRMHELATVAADPQRIADLQPDRIPELFGGMRAAPGATLRSTGGHVPPSNITITGSHS